MTFGQAIQSGLKNYANFEGRATRSEFWWFQLFSVLVFFAACLLGGILVGVAGRDGAGPVAGILVTVLVLIWLGFLLPHISIAVRRLHDSDHSGAWLLLVFVPLGGFVLLVWYCTASTPGPNKFGGDMTTNAANAF